MGRLTSIVLDSAIQGVAVDLIGGSPTIVSTPVRNSGSAGRTTVVAANRTSFGVLHTGAIDYFYRFYLRVTTRPDADSGVYSLVAGASAVNIKLRTTGALAVYNGASQVGVDSAVLANGVYHRVELHFKNNGAANTQVIELVVNGTTVATLTGAVLLSNPSVAYFGSNVIAADAATTGDWYIADIAINDSTGTVQNSYPGDEQFGLLYPIGAGDNTLWTAVGALGINWANVSEQPPDDITTYVQRTTTTIKVDDYVVTSPAAAGIGAGDTINCVTVSVRGGATNATANIGRQIFTRIKSQASGTVHKSAGAGVEATVGGTTGVIQLNVNAQWVTETTVMPAFQQLVAHKDPTTGLAWTRDGTNSLANMQIGMETESSATTAVRVTRIRAVVAYVPAAGFSDTDTATMSETATAAATISVPEAVTATESESASVQIADTETITAVDSESGLATISDAEAIGAVETESATATATVTDTATLSETESASAQVSDTEQVGSAETESAAAAIADADAGVLVDSEGASVSISDSDGGVMAEIEAVLASLSDEDAMAVVEGELVVIFVTEHDTITADDTESVATIGPAGWRLGSTGV